MAAGRAEQGEDTWGPNRSEFHVELKAVDANYPLVGQLKLTGGRIIGAPLPGTAWLSEGAAQRLGLSPGGKIAIGTGTLTVGGIIAPEPDRLGEGFAFGAVALVGEDVPRRAGLIAPGSMYRSKLWTMRMFAGFGTAEDEIHAPNESYRLESLDLGLDDGALGGLLVRLLALRLDVGLLLVDSFGDGRQ